MLGEGHQRNQCKTYGDEEKKGEDMFSLLDEPWIRVQDITGSPLEVSIRQVFDGSQELSRVRGESPAQDYAVLRMLLAIFWRAHQLDQDADYREWLSASALSAQRYDKDERVLEYLDRFAERFNLLDDEAPFMQVADLRTKDGATKSISMIVPEAQDDYFTMRAGEELHSLSLAEATRWLVYMQAFDYSGIKSGALGDSRVKGGRGYPIGQGWSGFTGGTVVHGETLSHTLVLNTVEDALKNPSDLPVWERTPDGANVRSTAQSWRNYPVISDQPMGAADLATWQTRRIRLFTEGDRVTSVVIANGDKIPDAGANVLQDPMTPYRWSKNKSKKGNDVYFPKPYDETRTLWRSLDALIVAETDGGFSEKEKAPKRPKTLSSLSEFRRLPGVPRNLDVELVSLVYGSRSSSVASTVHATLGMPIDILVAENRQARARVRAAAAKVSHVATALGAFGGNLFQAAGGEYAFKANLADRFYSELEFPFVEWISNFEGLTGDRTTSTQEFDNQWEQIVFQKALALAETELRGAGPKTLAGRELPRKEGEAPRFISAGSAHSLLKKKLRDILPSTAASPSAEVTKEKGAEQ